jgi:hypothetical protein
MDEMPASSVTDRQRIVLRAVANRIVPPDQWPGAGDVGAVDFIERLLRNDLPQERQNYSLGLNAIDEEVKSSFGRSFSDLSDEDQDSTLRAIEAGDVKTNWPIAAGAFFRMVVEHVLEGFYADPGNGGNRDAVSWRMVSYRAEGEI